MSPRAVGVHAPWPSMPAAVRDWVVQVAGSPVASFEEQTGGMSPGCATRLVFADGSRAFVKAVGSSLNPGTPLLFRREREVLERVGPDPRWAELLAAYDDGDWVALLLEDVDGVEPDLTDDGVLAWVCGETDRLSERLAKVPVVPGFVREVATLLTNWSVGLDHVADIEDELRPDWLPEQADHWRSVLDRFGTYPSHLVHSDVRSDNLLVRPSGELVFVDWGMALHGPAWFDPLLARLERVDDPWFDTSVASSPGLAEAGEAAVTAWLVGCATWLAWQTRHTDDRNLPTLRAFRIQESQRMFAGASRRLGQA